MNNKDRRKSVRREYYSDLISVFLEKDEKTVLGELTSHNEFSLESVQRDAWIDEIKILKSVLKPYLDRGAVYFEYSIPRLGRRIDVVLLIDHVIFVLEFKVGESSYTSHAIDQVWDYALDLKNFHETSHEAPIAPVLIATESVDVLHDISASNKNDNLLSPLRCNVRTFPTAIHEVLDYFHGSKVEPSFWESGRYRPPTIVEAATALYGGHSVEEISRSNASAINLTQTSDSISDIIEKSKAHSEKAICFVTGVPGAGKTLVGLNIATKHMNKDSDLYSVFLSGNGPLVAVLREALARDKVRREKECGKRARKGEVMSEVKMFIQNVHHFRDECLADAANPPVEHVALFDEAQRAWNLEQTSKFMKNRKKVSGFSVSEPEFLISCMDRHANWAVIICLVGGGQEINTGEAGISEWIESLNRSFHHWKIYISSRITDAEYAAGQALSRVANEARVALRDDLHLGVSLRSFRAENVSRLVKEVLDIDVESARYTLAQVQERFPVVLTRDIRETKSWLRSQARGTERFGILASSQAERLKPYAIDVKSPVDPVHWFLDGKQDVRSSYYLEDVATEFHCQGLELDWACVTWDGDFRFANTGWEHWSFCGDHWNRIRKAERKVFLKNAYRVLLTRARQGMVIFVPEGESNDPTRKSEFYDSTYEYLRSVGISAL
ncbi:MAG: DUF2075 domain-containing protein [Planctomycetes bacterium]|nr:DUF2075 domain-containing protein [Planctomycetota bacterium]